MKICRALPLLLLLAAVPSGAHAQVVVQQTAAKSVWLKAEVIHADRNSMVVREQGNDLAIHTFTYSPDLKTRMEAIADSGGYQTGDKVKILYKQGQTVALKIHGKPSKTS